METVVMVLTFAIAPFCGARLSLRSYPPEERRGILIARIALYTILGLYAAYHFAFEA